MTIIATGRDSDQQIATRRKNVATAGGSRVRISLLSKAYEVAVKIVLECRQAAGATNNKFARRLYEAGAGQCTTEAAPNNVAYHVHKPHRLYFPIAVQASCKAMGTSVHHGCESHKPKKQRIMCKLRDQRKSSARAFQRRGKFSEVNALTHVSVVVALRSIASHCSSAFREQLWHYKIR